MRNITKLAIVTLALLLSAGLVLAQHNHAASQSNRAASGDDMMKACQKHGSETMAALDKLEKTIAAGRDSNDPSKMKAALDDAQKQLAEAKHHMSMCPMMSGATMQHDMNNMQHMSDSATTHQE